MDELFVRLLIVIGSAAIASGLVWLIRRPTMGLLHHNIDQDLLGPGIYLFTSSSCAECEPVRRRLTSELGDDGFREIDWDSDPHLFEELEISAVPATLVVDELNGSTLYPGDAGPALEALNP